MDNSELCFLSAAELARAIKAKILSPVEIIDAVLKETERLNPKLNAYCTVSDNARTQAKNAEITVMRGEDTGPLHGVPVSIKDLFFTKGIRTTGGSKIFENFVPDEDDIVVERLRSAGAIILGKTNTPEFAHKGVTDNPLFGETRNPWNLNYTPGGSSGGAAAAVAAGLGPVAIGTDEGGSIRIPSTFCGVFGFKPSYGRVPKYRLLPDLQSISHSGPITRTVADAALTMEVIAGYDYRDRSTIPGTGATGNQFENDGKNGIRIAWSPDLGYATVHPQVLDITSKAAQCFSEMGYRLDLAGHKIASPQKIFNILWAVSYASIWQDKLAEWRDRMDPGLVLLIERGRQIMATEYGRTSLNRIGLWEEIHPFFKTHDLLVTPTVAVPPFKLGHSGAESLTGNPRTADWIAFTYPFNLTGLPAASIPCGWTDDGLPIGLQIIGRPFEDATVLQAASAFEKARPWIHHRPLQI